MVQGLPIQGYELSFLCRKCGRVVCNACSPHRITIPYQYIVQPPEQPRLSSQRYPPSYAGGDGSFGDFSNIGGGERVRLCNPCVPDPNITPPQPQQSPNPTSPRMHGRSQSNVSVGFGGGPPPSGRLSAYLSSNLSQGQDMLGRHRSVTVRRVRSFVSRLQLTIYSTPVQDSGRWLLPEQCMRRCTTRHTAVSLQARRRATSLQRLLGIPVRLLAASSPCWMWRPRHHLPESALFHHLRRNSTRKTSVPSVTGNSRRVRCPTSRRCVSRTSPHASLRTVPTFLEARPLRHHRMAMP